MLACYRLLYYNHVFPIQIETMAEPAAIRVLGALRVVSRHGKVWQHCLGADTNKSDLSAVCANDIRGGGTSWCGDIKRASDNIA